MTGDEIKGLRRALDLTARRLGEALGVDQATVLAWEREELFPTKKHVEAMRALEKRGRQAEAGAVMPRGGPAKDDPARGDAAWAALADPGVWRLFRKIAAHPELRAAVEEAAAKYADPAGDDSK